MRKQRTFINENGKAVDVSCRSFKKGKVVYVELGIQSKDSNSTWIVTNDEAKHIRNILDDTVRK